MRFLATSRDRAAFLILVLGAAILYLVAPYIIGLLGAAVLYAVSVTSYRWLRRRLHPDVAAVITLVGAVLIIALPLTWLVGIVIQQAPEIARGAQESGFFERLSRYRIAGIDVGEQIARAGGSIATWLSQQAFDVLGSAAQAGINLFIAFFGLYYMLRSGDEMWRVARPYVPFSPATADALRERFFSVTRATLLGTGVNAVVQGSIVGGAIFAVGLPHAVFWGTMSGFASVLPVLGTALIWLPAGLWLLVSGRYMAGAILLGVCGIVASNVDNIIRPFIYRRVSNIHPMITLVGAFAGVRYMGLIGVLFGPLAIAYLFELVDFFGKEYGPPAPAPKS